jgi:hypothetical protein
MFKLTAPPPPVRPRSDSHVRLRAPARAAVAALGAPVTRVDAQRLLDDLCEEQLALTVNLACLERAIEVAPRDAAARAAVSALEARARDVADLAAALGALQELTVDPRVQRLFMADAALGDYTRGLYGWAHAVVRALEKLAVSLLARKPDWAMLRSSLEEAKNFHFDDLQPQIRAQAARLDELEVLEDVLDRLFVAAGVLETRLDRPFTARS